MAQCSGNIPHLLFSHRHRGTRDSSKGSGIFLLLTLCNRLYLTLDPKLHKAKTVLIVYEVSSVTKLWRLDWASMTSSGLFPLLLKCSPKNTHLKLTCCLPSGDGPQNQAQIPSSRIGACYIIAQVFTPISPFHMPPSLDKLVSFLPTLPPPGVHLPISCHFLCIPCHLSIFWKATYPVLTSHSIHGTLPWGLKH